MGDDKNEEQKLSQEYSAFISHASEDRDAAQAICKALETKGLTCWMAPRDVRAGKVYLDEIILGIEASHCLVLVLSGNANKSNFVRNEVERAYSKGRPIFPVRIEEVQPSRGLELLVSTAHWIDAWHGDLNAHVAKLALRLSEDADLSAALPPDLQRRIRLRRWMRFGGIAAMSLVIAVIVALIMRGKPEDNSQMLATKAPFAFFMGSLVSPAVAQKASVLFQDGFDEKGVFGIFQHPLTFEIYDITATPPKLIYRAEPNQFKGDYNAAKTFEITLPRLPIRVATCIAYEIARKTLRQITVAAYNFSTPSSQFATFPINDAGPSETYPLSDAKPDCVSTVQKYVASDLS